MIRTQLSQQDKQTKSDKWKWHRFAAGLPLFVKFLIFGFIVLSILLGSFWSFTWELDWKILLSFVLIAFVFGNIMIVLIKCPDCGKRFHKTWSHFSALKENNCKNCGSKRPSNLLVPKSK